MLIVAEMNPEGTNLTGNETMVFDGHDENPTVEGPKFYKRNGSYYIFAPAGGVKNGWQLVLRSDNVFGPYKEKVVLAQGDTDINGPHQGAWVTTPEGEDWFVHFQDKGAYGRITHLQPMKWIDGWPVIGADPDGDGIGEPVSSWQKPDVGKDYSICTPPESDEFNNAGLGLQWQWHANPSFKWGLPSGNLGFYRLNCIPIPEGATNLWEVPNLLLQKFPAEEFTATAKLQFHARTSNEQTGMLVMGEDYQYISLKKMEDKLYLRVVKCENARLKGIEQEIFLKDFSGNEIYFRVKVEDGALCSFSYSTNGTDFIQAGDRFQAKPGRWIGAKIGFFALREGITNDSGTVDIDWFRVTKQ